MLSEVSQVQKDKGHIFSLICQRQIQYKHKHYHMYTHTHVSIYTQSMFPKVGLLEETEGG
jgi:hypothetical protein